MEPIKVQIKNYRSIPIDSPITIYLKGGIQFIVGVNNVGKSNLLRVFSELRECFYLDMFNPQSDGRLYKDLKVHYDSIVNQHYPDKPITIHFHYLNYKEFIQIDPSVFYSNHVTSVYYKSTLAEHDRKGWQKDNPINALSKTLIDIMYIGASRVSIPQAAGSSFDSSIGQSFFQIWNYWASGQERDKMNKIAALIEELKELFGYKRFAININKGESEMIITNDDGVFSLHELGSGISHFIFALGNALFRSPSYILVDEPETGLHPKMQEVFVRSLAAKARFGLIATSHSIALARSVADEIHSLFKEEGKVKLVPFGEYTHLTIAQSISELGFSQYSEIGGNNILLVEGRTDIKCFREILRKWGMDKDFIVMSLGGADFISENKNVSDELVELKRLNAKSISVIFDSERNKAKGPIAKKLQSFQAICEKLKFNVFPTEFHSTENYISQNAISSVLGGNYKALKPFDSFNAQKNKWSKDRNWLMFREMKKEDFEGTELKTFIEKTLSRFVNT